MRRLITYTFLMLWVGMAYSQQLRVEPPNWWAGMLHDEVELMIYGKEISTLEPVSDDLEILSVRRTDNPNYLFVTISTAGKTPGSYALELQKKGRTKMEVAYDLLERRADSENRKGFDSSDLIYLIMPDRFANGDTDNDSSPDLIEKADRSLPGGRHGGDIQGVIDHLDYLQELGATALWSTPLCQDNDSTYSYHTYAQSDVYHIDARYGSNEDYRRLAQELHKRDMKLIMDYVTNHWGMLHWMIKDLPEYDWIHQFPGYGQTNYRMTTQMDPNASAIDTRYNEDGWFVKTMPDLNQRNPATLKYLIQNAIWWIEYADLDGFRVDTYSYGNKEGMAAWTKAIMDEYPNFNIVGEVWMHDQAQMAYWQKDSKVGAIQGFNSHLPSVMDFTLHDAISDAFKEEASWDKGLIEVYENFTNDFLYPDIDNIMVFAENHDTSRINELYPELQDYKLIMTLMATVRGIPQIYYGSEIGMKGDKAQGDADIRRDFPGGWEGDTQNAFEASGRTAEQAAYFDFSKTLFNWRKTATAIHKGKTVHFVPQDEVYVYFRILGEQRIMVVLNNNDDPVTLDLARFAEILEGVPAGEEVLTSQPVELSGGTLEVAGKTPMIIELK
ncbi:glycoside hydrolase family 13 protein [Robertkochia sediminum]|uniref:glycoside hydrolase family 13 protein n=1 Tax=Robertkochia sediminum TaxID=2785326 RepID=UPI0019337BAB|nr:glycoside hydrolase family 13 protein [Robertkochia sediminum]MBL7474026.1 glycoside hydrolase family 13 protein [Robertkochia sediminum]